jgi:hypothetical protein
MSMIINKINIISRPFFMEIKESPHTLKWIKSNEEEETKILWVKGKAENLTSLHPL